MGGSLQKIDCSKRALYDVLQVMFTDASGNNCGISVNLMKDDPLEDVAKALHNLADYLEKHSVETDMACKSKKPKPPKK